MKLSDRQWKFLKDVAYLIFYADSIGIKLTGGELYRTAYQQAEHLRTGASKTKNSKHLSRLAIDFNYFIDGKHVYDHPDLEKLGKYWEALTPGNRWGGFWTTFVDKPHFQAN